MAGMLEHCDFDEQVTSGPDDDGGRMRPDLVVHLPGGKNVAVDAKVPMQAFLDANEADDESQRRVHLASHGRQMKAHVDALSKKEYWKRVDPSPEFVVAFIPGDPLLTAALEHEPGLMEYAVANHVLLATPTSLIALLRAVAYGWQQDQLAENAREVQLLGAQLYERLSVLGEHFAGVGKGLNSAVGAYNKAVGSLESRVLVTARRFVDMGVVGAGEKELAHPATVDTTSRALQSAELLPPVGLSLLHGHRAVELDTAVGGTPGTGGSIDDRPDPSARPN
jgi:DNA recombination protein RmuC